MIGVKNIPPKNVKASNYPSIYFCYIGKIHSRKSKYNYEYVLFQWEKPMCVK